MHVVVSINKVDIALPRVCMVNNDGGVLIDQYVQPQEKVTDYRTFVSGIEPKHLKQGAVSLSDAQKMVANILTGRILVGHAVHHDLQVTFGLMLSLDMWCAKSNLPCCWCSSLRRHSTGRATVQNLEMCQLCMCGLRQLFLNACLMSRGAIPTCMHVD